MSRASATGVVEEMLDHAANARWDRLAEVLTDDFVIVEPASLPYGGEHHGADGYVALMQHINGLFELEFEPEGIHALDASTVLLRMHVTFTGRATGHARRLPVVELLRTRDGRVARSEVFLFDTAALLSLLP
jgi:ketosteroid isomerase-like protein